MNWRKDLDQMPQSGDDFLVRYHRVGRAEYPRHDVAAFLEDFGEFYLQSTMDLEGVYACFNLNGRGFSLDAPSDGEPDLVITHWAEIVPPEA